MTLAKLRELVDQGKPIACMWLAEVEFDGNIYLQMTEWGYRWDVAQAWWFKK